MRLNRVQRVAALHPGHLSLQSCPGSGKTRTLVARLLHSLKDVEGTTRRIACLTYTNTAVFEIESRLSTLAPSGNSICDVETLHSFCLKHIVVPHHWRLATFESGFDVIAPDDPIFQEIVQGVAADHGLNRQAAGEFEQVARGTGAYPDRVPPAAAEAFWAELDSRRLMDFSSIIYWSRRLIQQWPYIASGLGSRYRWVLVDEFQDTSVLQVDILRAIHRHGRTGFFLVGDPYQSIMSFAGARPELMDEFGHEIGARTDLALLSNYRSSRHILGLADALCPRGAPMLAEAEHRDHWHQPQWHAVASMQEGIAEVFLPEVRRQSIALSNAAILANRWTSLVPLARSLRGQVPVVGPGARPYRRANHVVAPVIEEVAARLAEPKSHTSAQVRRELHRLVQMTMKTAGLRMGFAGDVCAVRVVRAAAEYADLDAPAGGFVSSVAGVVARELLREGLVSATVGTLLEASGQAMMADIAANEPSHNARSMSVRDLGLFARRSESLRLLTMHGAKGREYDAVAIVDLFDGHVPFFKAQPGDEIEAEGRRLLYVALSRARKLLMLFTLAAPGERTQPSRFLPEIFPRGPIAGGRAES